MAGFGRLFRRNRPSNRAPRWGNRAGTKPKSVHGTPCAGVFWGAGYLGPSLGCCLSLSCVVILGGCDWHPGTSPLLREKLLQAALCVLCLVASTLQFVFPPENVFCLSFPMPITICTLPQGCHPTFRLVAYGPELSAGSDHVMFREWGHTNQKKPLLAWC